MYQLESTGTKLMRWAGAVVLVAGIQGGTIAWLNASPSANDFESQTGGAFILELSAETASPEEENIKLAIGKKSDEVAAVVASAPQMASVAVTVPDEQLPLLHLPDAPPEFAVTPLEKRPEEKPDTPKPMMEAKDAPQVAPRDASEAAAPEKIDNATKRADVPRGQTAGLSKVDRQVIENWRRDLSVHLDRNKRYPSGSQQRGTAVVAFSFDRSGGVREFRISRSSGSQELDDAALAMVKRASPLPAPPATVAGDMITFVVAVRFRSGA